MSKYYAVAVGVKVGIYTDWDEAKVNVLGYPRAKYKKFCTLKEAQDYLIESFSELPTNTNIKEPITPQKEVNDDINFIHIYTDGSHKDGKGGIGIAYVHNNKLLNTISQKILEYPTTNNVAELMAIYIALFDICGSNFVIPGITKFLGYKIYTDSEYCVNIFNKYIYKWIKNGLKKTNGEEIKNLDAINGIYLLLVELRKRTSIEIIWVKAHANNYFNNLVDALAKNGRDS